MVSADQIETLTSGGLDVGLMRPTFNRREFESLCIAREPLLLAAPEGHPLAHAERVGLGDLDRQPLVSYSPYEARYFYDLLAALFASASITPHYTQHISQVHSILGLVKAGIGLALVPQAALNLGFSGVVIRPIEMPVPAIVELHAAWRPGNANPAIAPLRTILRAVADGDLLTDRQAAAPAKSAS
jgi:DNA-binding transcriptional LysR family regulator